MEGSWGETEREAEEAGLEKTKGTKTEETGAEEGAQENRNGSSHTVTERPANTDAGQSAPDARHTD